MAQADPATARAVIIGVGAYTILPALPTVANNVRRISELLRDPDLWGLPEEHCRVLLDPAEEVEILDAVYEAASQATGTFLLYFAGHGLAEHREGLHLALPRTGNGEFFRAASFDRVRNVILDYCDAQHKVIILDTCFSGRALKGTMSGDASVADFAEIDGTFLMTSSAENKRSLAPDDKEYTLFTGELLKVLDQGDSSAKALLDMETIYRSVYRALLAGGGPLPQQRARNSGSKIAFIRNRARLQATASAATAMPAALPKGYERLLHKTVPDLLQELAEMVETGGSAEADSVLAAAAARWPDQQTAALLSELHKTGLVREAALSCEAVAKRSAGDVAACLHILEELDIRPVADLLLTALSGAPPTTAAGAAKHLCDQGYAAIAHRLMQTCLAVSGTEGTLPLMRALHERGLGDEALPVLRTLVTENPDPAYVPVADALLESGFAPTAYALYLTLPKEFAASRSPEAAAALLRTMADSGADGQAKRLLESLLHATRAGERVRWALALRTAGLDWADESTGKLLGSASASDVLRVMSAIRRGRPADLLSVARWATTTHRDANEVVRFAAALRQFGLPLDAIRLLTENVDTGPERAAALVASLRAEGREEATKLLARADASTVPDRTMLAAALRAHGAEQDAAQVLARVLESPLGELLPGLAVLAGEVDVETLHAHLAPEARGDHTAAVVRAYWSHGREVDVIRLLDLIAERESPLLEETLTALNPDTVEWSDSPAKAPPYTDGFSRSWALSFHNLEFPDPLAKALPYTSDLVRRRAVAHAASEPAPTNLGTVVSESLMSISLPELLTWLEVVRHPAWTPRESLRQPDERDCSTARPGLAPWDRPSSHRQVVWMLGVTLSRREDASSLLAALLESGMSGKPLWAELRTLMESAPHEQALAVYRLLSEEGHHSQSLVLAGLSERKDLSSMLPSLRSAGLRAGDAMRMQRAARNPRRRSLSQAVQGALADGLASEFEYTYTGTVNKGRAALHHAAKTLTPRELADLLAELSDKGNEAALTWVITAAVEREPLEDWLPAALAVLGGYQLDDLALQLVRAAVRRSRAWEVAATAEILREDGMDEHALMLEKANRSGRLTRWLNR
ncbi:caspase domain-containing protein [Streptomyces sp. NBC_01176]|uniref:caspase family protein n=1 Tax=Streptomyces sp. NBC_01176 TaxID=2903760 RepID=UPI00386C3834|nr:caspase family protein [Streptomyces sp. NBC_01176]